MFKVDVVLMYVMQIQMKLDAHTHTHIQTNIHTY